MYYKKDITKITTVDQLNADLFGKYTTYLAEKATVNRKEDGELVAYLTCLGYLSATKKHFQKKFINEKAPAVFEADKWWMFIRALESTKKKAYLS